MSLKSENDTTSEIPDPRHISHGKEIPSLSYSDQPYIIQTDDHAWLCVLTTGPGSEGHKGQHVFTQRSTDQGRSWNSSAALENMDDPESSYAVLLKAPSGRIFCFYNYNIDNIRQVIADDPPFKGGFSRRVDLLGAFVMKISDDHGRSWSPKRIQIPVREFTMDRQNPYKGKVRFFWNVGRPFIDNGAVYVPLCKIGAFGWGGHTSSEGVLLCSKNLLDEENPEKATWETLPDGETGIGAPQGGGPVAEEHSFCVLSDGTFYTVFRTIDGYPACARSFDKGHSWTKSEYLRYADGRLIHHPRAANFVWKCHNGNYLYWFHNNGGPALGNRQDNATFSYHYRNPVWLCGGQEKETDQGRTIVFSQPEIIIYDDDPLIRMSYPDLIETDSDFYITETQKDVARIHHLDKNLLQGLWNQDKANTVQTDQLICQLPQGNKKMPKKADIQGLPEFCWRNPKRTDFGKRDYRHGFSIDFWVGFDEIAANDILFDNRLNKQQGFYVGIDSDKNMQIVLNNGPISSQWFTCGQVFEKDKLNHVVIIVDGGPKLILYVVNGQLLTGDENRQFGWGRLHPDLENVTGVDLAIAPSFHGRIESLRIYSCALTVSQAISNYHAGCSGSK